MRKMLAGSILALMPTLVLAGGHAGLGGIVYPGESSIFSNYTVDTLPENIKEMQKIRYERSLAAPNILNMKPTLANINSTTKTPAQLLLETKAIS